MKAEIDGAEEGLTHSESIYAVKCCGSINKQNFLMAFHNSMLPVSPEVVSKPPLMPNFCVGPRDSILEILHIFLRLKSSPRLDFEPD